MVVVHFFVQQVRYDMIDTYIVPGIYSITEYYCCRYCCTEQVICKFEHTYDILYDVIPT